MKIRLFLFLFCSLFLIQGQKIGVIDINKLVTFYDKATARHDILKQEEKKHKTRLGDLKKSFEEKQKKAINLEKDIKNSFAFSEDVRRKKIKEFGELQKEIYKAQQNLISNARRAERSLEIQQAKFSKTIVKELSVFIKSYAEKNNFDLIIEKTATFFYKKSFDITKEIAQIINE